MPDLSTLDDAELARLYNSECAMSARLYAEGVDSSANEARIDTIAAELMARGIL